MYFKYRRISVQSFTQPTTKKVRVGEGGAGLSNYSIKMLHAQNKPLCFLYSFYPFYINLLGFLGGWWEWEYSTYSDILHLVGYIFRDKTSSVTIVKIVVKWLGLKFVYLEHPYVPPFLLFFTSTK